MIESNKPAALVPHAGSMCLLDAIRSFDASRVVCVSASHRRPDHPLRRDGRLASLHLIEYAAQAAAVHGALSESERPAPAPAMVLAGVRDVELRASRLDDIEADLHIEAERMLVMGDGALYRFRVSAADRLLAEGRLTVAAPGGAPS